MYNFTAEQIAKLSDKEQIELLDLMEQELLETVSPKLEAFRDPIIGGTCDSKIRIRGCRGGRGAGAKTQSLVSLIVQRANVEPIRVASFREVQNSIEESVMRVIQQKVEFLRYTGWIFKKTTIEGPLINGKRSHFVFKGLKDTRASTNVKGMEGFDIMFLEEAATLSMESLNLLLPTLMRTPGSQLLFAYNPEQINDPITTKIWNRHRADALCIPLLKGSQDNPWWNEGLQNEMEADYKADPIEADHVWAGNPRSTSDRAIISALDCQNAMDRQLVNNGGVIQIGCDVARFGDDRCVIYKRQALKIVDRDVAKKQDTMTTAYKCWDMANHDPSILIKVDVTGVGSGVVDRLVELGAKVQGINFGGDAVRKDLFANKATEMWFNFQNMIKEVDIPNDNELLNELTGRLFTYDKQGRRIIESKDEYKKRLLCSPDLADALLLCYDTRTNMSIDDKFKQQMRNRRR